MSRLPSNPQGAVLPPPLRSTLVDSPGLRIGGGVASGRVGGWPARTNPWAGGRVLGADAALQGGVCSVAGFWWDNAGPLRRGPPRVNGRQSAPRGGRPPVLDLVLGSTRGAFQALVQTRRLACSTRAPRLTWGFVAHPAGFEPATIGLEVQWLRTVTCRYVPFRVTPSDPLCRPVPCSDAQCRPSPELRSANGAHTGPGGVRWLPPEILIALAVESVLCLGALRAHHQQ